MRKFLVANWKENPGSESKAVGLFKEIAQSAKGNPIIICPPFVYLEKISEYARTLRSSRSKSSLNVKLGKIKLGAQDVFWEERGAFTGEVGPKMLRSLGVQYVIIGHSERRKYFKETDVIINEKVTLALRDGLDVILCVGESLAIRRKGDLAVKNFIKNQLKNDLHGINLKKLKPNRLLVAYEPIWAIGTGKTDDAADAVAMAIFIKKILKTAGAKSKIVNRIPFLYGGSVHSKNLHDFVQYKEIDGALVGGASLKAGEFGKMIKIMY